MKKTFTNIRWECDTCKILSAASSTIPSGWVEHKQKTLCSKCAKENSIDWNSTPEAAKKREEFHKNLDKFVSQSNAIIKQRNDCLEKVQKLSKELVMLSEDCGIPLEDSQGYFVNGAIENWMGEAKYIPDSFLDKEFWKLFRDGRSGYEGATPIPDQVFKDLYSFESEEDVSTGWNSSSC